MALSRHTRMFGSILPKIGDGLLPGKELGGEFALICQTCLYNRSAGDHGCCAGPCGSGSRFRKSTGRRIEMPSSEPQQILIRGDEELGPGGDLVSRVTLAAARLIAGF